MRWLYTFAQLPKLLLEAILPEEERAKKARALTPYLKAERRARSGTLYLLRYRSAKNHIQHLKFDRSGEAAQALAKALETEWENLLAEYQPDLVVPIPLSRKRRSERGFNQTTRLLKLLPHPELTLEPALRRSRHTKQQAKLSKKERIHNLDQAFRANPIFVKDKMILLVDDVVTTGTTLKAAECALYQAGAKQVIKVGLVG